VGLPRHDSYGSSSGFPEGPAEEVVEQLKESFYYPLMHQSPGS